MSITITEDELTEILLNRVAPIFTDTDEELEDSRTEARRLARKMIAAQDVNDMLTDTRNELAKAHPDIKFVKHMVDSALAASEKGTTNG